MQTQKIKDHGIVGAGGAGFPSHIKLDTQAEIVIMNAAECEPLLHKDKELLDKKIDTILDGFKEAIKITRAEKGIIGIKSKYEDIIAKIKPKLPSNCEISEVDDFYPAGYEINLVYETTGRLIQPGDLPISTGCVVLNVETLYNIGINNPVTSKYLTVGGAVETPQTIQVPVGTPIKDILNEFNVLENNFRVVKDGLMMGELAENLDEVITKKTAGLIILPQGHHYITMRNRYETEEATDRMAKAACDQCSYCTDLCPMYLTGYPVRPETAMRNRMFSLETMEEGVNPGNDFCCECNLCTLYACPEGLDPKGAIMIEKKFIAKQDLEWEGLPREPHPMEEYRQTPNQRLIQRLGVMDLKDKATLSELMVQPRKVELPLLQHIGSPAIPQKEVGDLVEEGEIIAKHDEGISANIHASIKGKIEEIDQDKVIIIR